MNNLKGNGKHAVLLLSGGLDSTTTLAIAQSRGYAVHALSFAYGQRHHLELMAAHRIAIAMGVVEHVTAKIDMFGGSALLARGKLPAALAAGAERVGIAPTYVPARNTVFLSFALAWAEVLGAFDIFLGVNAIDYSGYPDCRPEYIAAFEHLATLATKVGVLAHGRFKIHAPLIEMSKAEIIRAAIVHEAPLKLTSSCYDPELSGACGVCDSCLIRLAGFAEAGVPDPIRYRAGSVEHAS